MGSLKNYVKKVNDIALKFYTRVYLYEIALLFFHFVSKVCQYFNDRKRLEKGNNCTIVAIVYNQLLELILYMKQKLFFYNVLCTASISKFRAGNVTIILWEHAHTVVYHDKLSTYQSTLNYKHF